MCAAFAAPPVVFRMSVVHHDGALKLSIFFYLELHFDDPKLPLQSFGKPSQFSIHFNLLELLPEHITLVNQVRHNESRYGALHRVVQHETERLTH